MARAMTAPELAHIRSDNQWSKLYMAVLSPDTVMTARVNVPPTSDDEVFTINIDAASFVGGHTAAVRDMLVYVGSSAGAFDKGFVRLREDLTGSPTTMKIGEISEIEWANNDYITIVEEFPLAARHLFIDSSQEVFMDRDISYTDQHENPDPVPVLGPSLVPVWLTGATVDTEWDASNSYAITGTITVYAWLAPGASATSGLATATPTITYNAAGTYRVECTITTSTGATFTGYRFVMVFTAAAPPTTQFTLDDLAGTWDNGGWTARVTMYDEVSLTEIRQYSLVALFTLDNYGTTQTSLGPITDRENILYVGWVGNESITWDKETGTCSLEIQGPQYWLAQINGFPSGLEDTTSTPAVWTDLQTLTFRKGAWHFAHWRSTLTRIMDLYLTADTRGISIFNASPGTLWDQITSEAQATILAHPCADRFGRLFIEIEPQVIPTGSRGGIPTVISVTTQDLSRPFTLERRTVPTTGQVDLSGVVFSIGVGTPLFALAPGHVFKGFGSNIDRVDHLALSGQAQANTLAALSLGWKNNLYPNTSLPFVSNLRFVDICPHQYVSLIISSGDTVRGLSETLTLVPRSVSISHNPETGVILTDVQAESVTVDAGSINGDVPAAPPEAPNPDGPGSDWDPLPVIEPGWPTQAFVAGLGKGVYYGVGDFDPATSAQPVWTAINGGLPTLDVTDFGINIGTTGAKQQVCRLDTDEQIYIRDTDVSSNWSLALSSATVQGDLSVSAIIETMGVDLAGRIWVYVNDNSFPGGISKHFIYYSDDWGGTWSGPNAQDHANEFDDDLKLDGGGMVNGYGTDCWASNWTHLSSSYLWYGPSSGAGPWKLSGLVWGTSYTPPLFLHPAGTGEKAYSNRSGQYISEWASIQGDLDPMSELESDGLWGVDGDPTDQRWNSMWGSWSDVDFMRCYTRFGGAVHQRIAETDDNWTTYSLGINMDTLLGTAWIVGLAPVVQELDEDMIAFSVANLGVTPNATYHAIWTMLTINGTPRKKAGSLPNSSPFTNSIPYDIGQIAKNGIQFVRGS